MTCQAKVNDVLLCTLFRNLISWNAISIAEHNITPVLVNAVRNTGLSQWQWRVMRTCDWKTDSRNTCRITLFESFAYTHLGLSHRRWSTLWVTGEGATWDNKTAVHAVVERNAQVITSQLQRGFLPDNFIPYCLKTSTRQMLGHSGYYIPHVWGRIFPSCLIHHQRFRVAYFKFLLKD